MGKGKRREVGRAIVAFRTTLYSPLSFGYMYISVLVLHLRIRFAFFGIKEVGEGGEMWEGYWNWRWIMLC